MWVLTVCGLCTCEFNYRKRCQQNASLFRSQAQLQAAVLPGLSAPPPPAAAPSSGSGGLSGGAIVGIVIGSLVGAVLLAALA